MTSSALLQWAAPLGLLGILAATPASGQQVVIGVVTDELFDVPLEGVQVALELRDEEDEPVVVVTDAEGRFAALLPGPGDYHLRTFFRRYDPILFPLEVPDSDEPVEVRVEMKPQPLELDGIFVEVEEQLDRPRRLDLAGFTRREKVGGAGRFLGPEDLEDRRFSMRQVFRGIPGLRVTEGEQLRMVAPSFGGSGLCEPTIYVDGTRLGAGFPVTVAVPIQNLNAVEVYNRPAFAPAQYRPPGPSGCGIVLFWTR